MGLFSLFEFAVTVAGGCQGNGVKGSCVEGNHRQQYYYHDNRGTGHGFDHGYDHSIEIAIFHVLCDKISFSGYLHSHGVIAEDDKTDQSGSNAETITSQNSLADGSSTGDAADENGAATHQTIQYAQ